MFINFEWIVIKKSQRVARVVASYLFPYLPTKLHSGGVGWDDGNPEDEHSCFKSLLISGISPPVHNLSIRILLSKITIMILVYKGFSDH